MADRRSSRWSGLSFLGKLTRRPARGRRESHSTPDLVVVGLGNPGPEYEETRHNAGFWAVDELADHYAISLRDRRKICALGEGEIEDREVVLAKPRTYVNESGAAARYLLSRYPVGHEKLLVLYDDMDLAPGRLRLRANGGGGGHNGMKSIISAIGDQGFPRLRIGVGRPGSARGDIGHVLGPPSKEERQLIADAVSRVPRVVAGILTDGITRTMDWANRD